MTLRHKIAALAAAALLLGAGSTWDVASAAGTPAVATTARVGVKSSETGIQYTSKTIVVSRAAVRSNLIGISTGGTFKFKHAAGPLAKLKAGKVMLLQGSDALLVTKVTRSHGQLLIATKPADLTDVISSGQIKFSGVPNFAQAVASQIVVPASSAKAAEDFAKPAYPYVGSSPDPLDATLADAPSLGAQGTYGPFGYSLTFTPAGSRLNIDGTICFATTSVCGNGPSSGLSLEARLSGYIAVGETSGGLSVSAGKETGSSFSLGNFTAHLKYTYTVTRGDGSDGDASPPVFHVPVGIDYTIPGEIPIYLKLQTAIEVKLGVTSKNSSIFGGLDINTAGSDTLKQNGGSVASSESGDSISGDVLDQSDGGAPASITLGPAGVLVALQFPKLGVGLGFTSANAIAYVDLISAIGQTTGSALAGMFCSSFDIAASIGAGLEAQVGLGKFGLSLNSPRKILYPADGKQLTFATHTPGCPAT